MKLKVIDAAGYTVGTVTAVTNPHRTGLLIEGVEITVDGLHGRSGKAPAKHAGKRHVRAIAREAARTGKANATGKRANGPVRVIRPADRQAA